MKQILALIRQNPFFSAVSVIGTAVSITFVMVIYMVYDIQTADLAPESHRSIWYILLMDILTVSPTAAIPIRVCLIGLSTLFLRNFREQNLSPIWDLPILDTVGSRQRGECAARFVRWI